MNHIKWIFFDVGSTLVDETEAYDHRVRDMIAGTPISFEEFDRMRTALAVQGCDGNSAAIRYFHLKKTPWHSEDEVLYADTDAALQSLRERGFHLGIIANQAPGTVQRLEDWGVLKYFDRVFASAEMGIAKPNRAIFKKALDVAGCQPEESVMVGDRLDNDIAPAKAVGMKTVWLRKGLAQFQPPELGAGIADYQIDTLIQLLSVMQIEEN